MHSFYFLCLFSAWPSCRIIGVNQFAATPSLVSILNIFKCQIPSYPSPLSPAFSGVVLFPHCPRMPSLALFLVISPSLFAQNDPTTSIDILNICASSYDTVGTFVQKCLATLSESFSFRRMHLPDIRRFYYPTFSSIAHTTLRTLLFYNIFLKLVL